MGLLSVLYKGLFILGAAKVFQLFFRLIQCCLQLFVLPTTNFAKYGGTKKSNSQKKYWACVTGASDGIGKEYAYGLAARGFNVLLVSRTESKLVELQKNLVQKYGSQGVEVDYLSMDCAQNKDADYAALKDKIANKKITVLVNNVGLSHDIPVSFLDTDEKEMNDIITINNVSTLRTTKIVLPNMMESVSQNGDVKGLILTMGSFGALFPSPLLATYSGSKAFLQNWSSALSGELKEHDIDCELVLSYLVTSKMSKIRRSTVLIPTPKQFVRSVLNGCGYRGGAQERMSTMTPYWSHGLYHFVVEETYGCYSSLVNMINLKFHKSIRSRALKKRAKKN